LILLPFSIEGFIIYGVHMSITSDYLLRLIATQPEYLTKNWWQIMAVADDPELKLIRVRQGVVNITNKAVLTRTALETPEGEFCPDGFYRAIYSRGPNGERILSSIVEAESSSSFSVYPDVDRVMPNLNNLAFQRQMTQEQVMLFMAFCQEIASVKGTVVISKNYAVCLQNNQITFGFNFDVPEDIQCYAVNLLNGVKEASRYPSIYITRENTKGVVNGKDVERKMPLILGNGWRNCAMVATTF
jgi:hypothetical protein